MSSSESDMDETEVLLESSNGIPPLRRVPVLPTENPSIIGDSRELEEEFTLEWSIPEFCTLSTDTSYKSRWFLFQERFWFLSICSYGEKNRDHQGYVSVFLHEKGSSPGDCCSLTSSFSLRKADGEKFAVCNSSYFSKFTGGRRARRGSGILLKRSELIKNSATLIPDGVLTIFCTVRRDAPGLFPSTPEFSLYRSLMVEPSLIKDEDIVVHARVQGECFRLLKRTLDEDAPVFAKMFENEKNGRVITIRECSAEVFRIFLHYLNTGEIYERKLSTTNVFDLLKFADKYQLKTLANGCVDYIRNTLSVETFCDAAAVAFDRQEKMLIDKVVCMMLNSKEEIETTRQWQCFPWKYPAETAALLSKTCACEEKYLPPLEIEGVERILRKQLIEDNNTIVTVRIEEDSFMLTMGNLASHSPVFAKMFRIEEMQENGNVIHIEECSAEIFRIFTHFLDTGKVDEQLSTANVFDLLKFAEKYEVKELAYDCVDYIRETLSVETFCDALQVAFNRQDTILMKSVVCMMSTKRAEIVTKKGWSKLFSENPDQVAELISKVTAYKMYKK